MNTSAVQQKINSYLVGLTPTQFFGLTALLFYPILALTVHYAADGLFALLFVIALADLVFYRNKKIKNVIPWWVYVSFLFYPAAILIQYAHFGYWYGEGFDAALRLVFAPAVLLFLSRVEAKYLRLFLYASAIGCLVTFLCMDIIADRAYVILWGRGHAMMSPTRLGFFILNFGVFSYGVWSKNKFDRLISLTGMVFATLCSYYTQTRGAWIALIAVVLFLIIYRNRNSILAAFWKILILTGILIAVGATSPIIQDRVKLAVKEISTPIKIGKDETSIGLRKQIYVVSMAIIEKHPFWGVGRNKMQAAYDDLLQHDKRFSPDMTTSDHAHNEILYAWVELGVLGLIGFFFLLLGPWLFFWRHRSDQNITVQKTALLGMMLVILYFFSGLPDIVMTAMAVKTSLYALTMIVPIAIIASIKGRSTQH